MLFSQSLALLLLPFTALAAKKPADKFTAAASKSFPIKLSDSKFTDLTSTPRDFATLVLLTALEPRFGCGACREFQPEWELLARSWQKGDKAGASRTLFGTLDFADGKATFQSVRLLLSSEEVGNGLIGPLAWFATRSRLASLPSDNWPECQIRSDSCPL
jgi:oligosaccharyltransferase complex subunit gamma